MSAKESDARTQGTITAQLMLDQFGDGTNVDRILDGDTQERWLDPWAEYLEKNLKVTFRPQMKLQGFNPTMPVPTGPRSAPLKVFNATFQKVKRWGAIDTSVGPETVDADIFVLAIPMEAANKMVGSLAATDESFQTTWPFDVAPSYPDLVKGSWAVDYSVKRLHDFPRRVFPFDADPNYVWMFGMQFFLRDDLPILKGHLYYPDSAFGLSSISQPQFWADDFKQTWGNHLVGGAISVDIGDWGTPAPAAAPVGVAGKMAYELTKQELVDEIWRQLHASLNSGRYHQVGHGVTTWRGELPDQPLYWFVGDELYYPNATSPPTTNTPFLINRPTEYMLRPGTPGYYRVHIDQFVMAGNWMQTHTRLNTMEGSNESARHAVNAILRHYEYEGDECTIWNPEHCEPGAFNAMQDLDAKLHAQGLPHVFNALGVYCGIKTFLPTGCFPTLLTCASLAACMGKPGTSGCGPAPSGPLNTLMQLLGVGPDTLASIFGVDVGDLVDAEQQVLANEANAVLDAEQAMLDHIEGRAIPRVKPEIPKLLPEEERGLLGRLRTLRAGPVAEEQGLVPQDVMEQGTSGGSELDALRAWASQADPHGLAEVDLALADGELQLDLVQKRGDLGEGERQVLLDELQEAAWSLRIAQGEAITNNPVNRALVEALGDAAAAVMPSGGAPELGRSTLDEERRASIGTLFAGPLQALTWGEVPENQNPRVDHRTLHHKLPQPKRRPPMRRRLLSKLLGGLQNPK